MQEFKVYDANNKHDLEELINKELRNGMVIDKFEVNETFVFVVYKKAVF